jgi:hypothetical protein
LGILFILINQLSASKRTITFVDIDNVDKDNTHYSLIKQDFVSVHRSKRDVVDSNSMISEFNKTFNTTDIPEFPKEISDDEALSNTTAIKTDSHT